MPLRNAAPLTFKPVGASDALDGTNAFPGALAASTNLVPAPHTESILVPRPAAEKLTAFPDFTVPGAGSALLVVGDRAYGMIASQAYPNRDEPFCFDLVGRTFVPISGVTIDNLPTSIPTTGSWIPPTIAMITNGKIVITHDGFAGGASPYYFGWLDMSAFALQVTGNTISGERVIRSIGGGPTSAPIQYGVQPGQAISGPGIPAGSTVVSATNGTFSLTTTGATHTTNVIDGIASLEGVEVGMTVTSPSVAVGTVVVSIDSPTQVTIDPAALDTDPTADLVFSGGGTITISQDITATGDTVTFDIAGGSFAAPQWGAGNLNGNPLAEKPRAVSQYNGRAWYAVDNEVAYSDSLNPLQRTGAAQALTLGDSQPVTALAGLPLSTQVTGGVVQALVAFKGGAPFFQITGDATTNNLSQNQVNGSVGTLAPNTICATPLGLAFIAIDGMRVLGLNGTLSEPVGSRGKGIVVPFLSAIYPSRMVAAFNQNTYRVSVQSGAADTQPYQEWWFHLDVKAWSGPHSFVHSLIEAYYGEQVGFIGFSFTVPATLWSSNVLPSNASTFVENDVQMTFNMTTTLVPDNAQMEQNAIVETTLALILAPAETIHIRALDEDGNLLDELDRSGAVGPRTIWGAFRWGRARWSRSYVQPNWGSPNWGEFYWGQLTGRFKQYRLPWTKPLVFKQMQIEITGESKAGFGIGNLYLRYQILGYMIQQE